ncbi:MAG TPA: hypothetical protein ENK06_11295, partial [Gammaproteobacteria bacterium]|nr:hypothetical protein [Gammaproteobacteria bacterium]
MSGLKALNAKQAGLATLMSAIVLLMVISMISVYTARVSVTEQKISSNQYRSQQAFEAAEAGLNSAIYNLNMDIVHRALCVGSEIETSGICKGHSAGTGVGTEADFTGEQALVSLQANKTGDFSLTFSKNPDNDNIVNFSVYGYASDNPRQDEAPNQILRQSLLMRPVLNYHPPAPLIARSTLTLRSPTMITNKDIDSLAAFWSGGAAILLGLPMVDVVSTNGLETGGYYQNDDVLAGLDRGNPSGSPAKPNKFFENFFSDTFVNLKNRSLKLVCRTGCDETDLSGLFDMSGNPLGNHIIWVDANAGSGFEKLSVNNAIDLG